MGFFDDGRVIIRAAVNEMQPKSINPTIPYGADEVAAEAVACAQEGASIVHFHSRTDDGRQALDDDAGGAQIYRRALALTGQRSNIVLEPTNLRRGPDPSLASDIPHIWALAADPPERAPLEIVNIDAFRFDHRKVWIDVPSGRLVPVVDRVPRPEVPYQLPPAITGVLNEGFVPFFGLFDLADARLLMAFALQGYVPQPVLIQINLFCDIATGPTPGVAALDAFLSELSDRRVDKEICVFVRSAPSVDEYEALLNAALERGIHLRVGVGDNPQLYPDRRSADMVRSAVGLAQAKGLTPVTSNELRTRVGLPVRQAP
jgi:uncharacterized protein (DUF849 family)